ncbi:MAG: TRAP transporter substrate-binding protein [Pseudomonadota bacterium]
MSLRAALFAVVIAFAAGLLGSLALRPVGAPGGAAASETETTNVASQASVRWRVPIAFGTNLPALGDNIVYVADLLRRFSSGRIDLNVYEPGEIVPTFSIVDAVRDGKVQAGYTWLGYDQGKIPASALLGAVPFGLEPWEYSAWWFEGGGRELGEALYAKYGVHLLFCGIIGPETAGWFRRPINSLADVAGLKIRFAGLGGKVIGELGASVTMLPGGEIFQALEKGAIDATEYSLPVVDQKLGFDRVAKLNYFPGWHQPSTASHLAINQSSWQRLSGADQAAVEAACTAGVTRNLARSEQLQGGIIAGFPGIGVTAGRLPDDMLRQLQAVTERVMQEEANKDPDFAKIYASQRAFRADYAHWKRLAYLPRDFDEQGN